MEQRLPNFIRNSRHVCYGLAIALVLAIWLQGSVWQAVLLFFIALVVLVPLFVGTLGEAANATIRKTTWGPAKSIAKIWCTYAACFGFSYLFGLAINEWKIEAAHSYVARAAPVLEQIKAREGSYPVELPIGHLGPMPVLLRSPGELFGTSCHGPSCYWSDGDEYCFHFVNPASLFGDGEMFNSGAGFWTGATSD